MNAHTMHVYESLWNYDEELAQKIVRDGSVIPSLRAIAYYLLHDYAEFKKLCEMHKASKINNETEAVLWLETQLMLTHLEHSKPLAELKKDAEQIASLDEHLIFARILLATILAQDREYEKSISLYEVIVFKVPANVSILTNLMGIYILAKQMDRARSLMRKANQTILGLKNPRKRMYWQLAFFIYGFRVYTEKSIFANLAMFVIGLFPLPFFVPIFIVGALYLIALFFHRKDVWASSLSVRLAISMSLAWLVGYGIKFLETL